MPSEAVKKRRSGAEKSPRPSATDLRGTQGCHIKSSARSEECRDSLSRLDSCTEKAASRLRLKSTATTSASSDRQRRNSYRTSSRRKGVAFEENPAEFSTGAGFIHGRTEFCERTFTHTPAPRMYRKARLHARRPTRNRPPQRLGDTHDRHTWPRRSLSTRLVALQHGFDPLVAKCFVARRVSGLVPGVNVGATLEQHLHHRCLTLTGGKVQRRPVPLVASIDFGTAGEQ